MLCWVEHGESFIILGSELKSVTVFILNIWTLAVLGIPLTFYKPQTENNFSKTRDIQ